MDLTVRSERRGSTSIVSAEGEVDLASAENLQAVLEEAVGSDAHEVVVDLSNVTFIDSTGIGVLAGALRTPGDLRAGLVVSPGPVEKVLLLTGMDRVFPLFESLEAAIQELTTPPAHAD